MNRSNKRVRPAPLDPIEPAILAPKAFDNDDLEPAYSAVAVFASIVAAGIAAAGYLSRLGFADNSSFQWASDVGLSWFLIHFAFVVRRLLRAGRVVTRPQWWLAPACLALAGLALAAAGGVEQMPAARGICGLFLAVGVGGLAWRLVALAYVWQLADWATLLGFAAFFSLYAVGAGWGLGYQNPLCVEAICFGHAQIDSLFHATFSNMLRTYGIPSTGLDGLPFIHYHFGSHWLFARLCNLLNVRVIDFYNRAYPVIFIPFGIFSLGTFAAGMVEQWRWSVEFDEPAALGGTGGPALRGKERGIGPLFWFVLTAGYIGFLPYASGFFTTSARNAVIGSESYALAVATSLLGIAAASAFFREVYEARNLVKAGYIFGFVAVAAASGAIGLLKISIMLILIAAGGFLFFRLRLFRSTAALILAAAAVIPLYYAYSATSNPAYEEMTGFIPFGFLRENIDYQWWSYFWFVYYAWVWIFAAIRFREEGIRTLGGIVAAFREGRIIDVETLCVIAIVGAAPGLLLTMYSSTHYFSDYQEWVALGLVLSVLIRGRRSPAAPIGETQRGEPAADSPPRVAWWPDRIAVSQVFAGALALAVGGTLVTNTLMLLNTASANVVASRGGTGGSPDDPIRLLFDGRFAEARNSFLGQAAKVEKRFESDKNVLAVLDSLDKMPLAEKRRSLLFIPKSNTHFWKLVHGPYSPKDGPFIATALSGVAMIDGLYVRPEDDPWTGYGYQHYPIPIVERKQPPLEQYIPSLRGVVAARHFSQLIVIESDADGKSKASKYDCP